MKIKEKGHKFPIIFGNYFERYVEDVIRKSKVENIININDLDEFKEKIKPDFEFKKFGIRFFIECKSRLISNDDFDSQKEKQIFEDEIKGGFDQLQYFKSNYSTAIRIIVLYEDVVPICGLYEKQIRNGKHLNERYWILTIGEFESFMGLNEEKSFKRIINEKLRSQNTNKPLSINQILHQLKLGEQFSNVYMEEIIKETEEEIKKREKEENNIKHLIPK